MKVLSSLAWGCAVGWFALAGCEDRHSRERQPVFLSPQTVVVPQAPPAVAVYEPRSRAPGSGYVWINGFWAWSDGRYVWQPGHWAVPPAGQRAWVGPHYERHEHGYRYVPGYWK